MNILRTIVTEFIGLFVDDWAYAGLIVAWVVLFAFAGPNIPAAPYVFFAGFAALLLGFAVRKARSTRAK